MATSRRPRTRQSATRFIDDDGLVVEAARLFYRDNRTQEQVARRLKVSQATVARLLERARDRGMVQVAVVPPRSRDLEEQLRNRLSGTRVSKVRVVPGPADRGSKNVDNLASAAAEIAIEAIGASVSVAPALTVACGETLRAVCQILIRGMKAQRKKRTFNFYPASIYPGHTFNPVYPSALLTTLATMMSEGFYPGDDPRLRINAFAPSLPSRFYQWATNRRNEYLEVSEIKDVVDAAKKSDLFMFGIGRVDDKGYVEVTKEVRGVDGEKRRVSPSEYPGEINFVPFDKNGREHRTIASRIVGLKPDDLRAIAGHRGAARQVVGIGGGHRKRAAVRAALRDPWFNVLVTDVPCAEYVLDRI